MRTVSDLLKEYQRFTATTAVYPYDNAFDYLINGLTSEAGEVAGKYAKHLRGDKNWEETTEAIDSEMGDVLWMVSQWCNETNTTLEQLMLKNMQKLKSRQDRCVLHGDGDDR